MRITLEGIRVVWFPFLLEMPDEQMLLKSLSVILILACASSALAGSMFDKVRSTRVLSCGIVKEEPDYTKLDAHGNRAAFDADFCKAVGAAALGEQARLTLTAYPDEASAFKALKTGEVALLSSATPDLSTASGSSGFGFARTLIFDGQGFLVPKSLGISSAKQLAGKKICFLAETDTEENLRAWVEREKIDFVPFPFQEEGEMAAAFVTGNCSGLAGDITHLAFTRALFKSRAKDFDILSEIIALDPLAPAYVNGDAQWAAVVNWTAEILIQAEASGVGSANLDAMKTCKDPTVRRLLGIEAGIGHAAGLDDLWASRVIKSVGNYGEMFDRDLGQGSPLKIPRGLNELWNRGGAMYRLATTRSSRSANPTLVERSSAWPPETRKNSSESSLFATRRSLMSHNRSTGQLLRKWELNFRRRPCRLTCEDDRTEKGLPSRNSIHSLLSTSRSFRWPGREDSV